jgi:dienelactone hydrolase
MAADKPQFVDPNGATTAYEIQPSAIKQTPAGTACVSNAPCLTTAIGLQPGAPAVSNGLNSKPLKEATSYGVIITSKVKDINGGGLSRSTLGKILLFNHSLVTGATSNLLGVDNATAGSLEVMRQQVDKLVSQAQTDGKISSRDQVAMAYTFRTQSITTAALQLAAAPYAKLPSPLDGPFCPTDPAHPANCVRTETALQAFTRFGIDSAVAHDNIDNVYEFPFVTLDLLDPATGAFRSPADQTASCVGTLGANPCLKIVTATVAVPKASNVTQDCPDQSGAKCAPVVVFRHGIDGGRGTMLLLADAMAAKGMITVAIDAAKHGERSYCASNSECAGGKLCVPDTSLAGQGDATAPGTCGGNFGKDYAYRPVSCSGNGCGAWDATKGGIPLASGNYIITANFFRARDTFRQDILDQSQLVRVMAPTTQAQAAANPILANVGAKGYFINPLAIYLVGQSLGGINSVATVAANPRISKVVLNVTGGTLLDTFTNSPDFHDELGGLLQSLGIQPGTPDFLKFLNVAKWIIDPADAMNFAVNLRLKPLPNLLTGAATPPAQAPKKVLAQRAQCDTTVPDFFQLLMSNNIGLGPVDQTHSTVTLFTTDFNATSPLQCPSGAVPHGFLTGGSQASLTAQAQADAAAFFANDTLPAPLRIP